MWYALGMILLGAALTGAAGPAAAEPGLSIERSGLGLRPPIAPMPWTGGLARKSELASAWQATESGDIVYGGVREAARLGVRTGESYAGIYHALSDAWGASVEMGVIQASPFAPRRYSLTGQLHTALAAGSGLSVGLKYRAYEPDPGMRGMSGEMTGPNAYLLEPLRAPGAVYGPSYQLQVSYQYNAANSFGLLLGRELETFTPGFDVPGGGPRQFTFTGQHWLTPSWALSYDVLNDPGNSFRLQGLRFGVRYRW